MRLLISGTLASPEECPADTASGGVDDVDEARIEDVIYDVTEYSRDILHVGHRSFLNESGSYPITLPLIPSHQGRGD